ncbi:hypothetical protein CSKR_106883 [Clonorchis sinensis]|uniref:Uncharacterized protein n=1 Tax=Clonorchis sinensis TaxID=79923 RepID=A0A3R7CA91_CLOSI|nr:hypothetical protein CSKR_106883 [Clonorchis sinensis]
MSPHMLQPPNLEDQETVLVRPLTIDQRGMRDTVNVEGTPPSITQWVTSADGERRENKPAAQFHVPSANLLTGRSVVRIRPLPLDFPCLGLGNLAVSQPSCNLRVAWQLGTQRVLQLKGYLLLLLSY